MVLQIYIICALGGVPPDAKNPISATDSVPTVWLSQK